jgi:aspartate aminotransferase
MEPEGAFYLFPDVSSHYGKSAGGKLIRSSDDFCEFLLEEARVALVPGSAFGDDRCLRLSFASSDERLSAAFDRMGEAFAMLR